MQHMSHIMHTVCSCKLQGVILFKLISGVLRNFRWDLWLGAMGSPSPHSISMPWIACWFQSYTAGGARGVTSPLSWSSSFTSWRTSLRVRAHTHEHTITLFHLFNPDHNSVSSTTHPCCHRFQGNKSIQRANQTTSKVCIHLIHSRVERRGLTL